jgi:hypothetical protein
MKKFFVEVKRRFRLVLVELKDVFKATKEVGNQIGDIGDAVKGKKRKGRKNVKK